MKKYSLSRAHLKILLKISEFANYLIAFSMSLYILETSESEFPVIVRLKALSCSGLKSKG
jgi:hypothetical protein